MSSAGASDNTVRKGILTDVTKCIGCERCVEACVRVNKLPEDFPAHYKAPDGLSAERFTSIVKIPGKEEGTWRRVRRQCMHCQDPSCAAACLVGAFTKRPDGAVDYDASKCIGCRYCMLACPFMIPRYEYDQPLPYIRKCKMNEECRVPGGQPACVDACPTGATIFGPREELIKEAKRRIAQKPELYVNRIYGEHIFGGTSVMYISDVPLGQVLRIPSEEELRRRAVSSLARESIPKLLHGWVMVTPFQFVAVSSGLTGIWFLRRRAKLMRKRAEQDAAKKAGKHQAASPPADNQKEGGK
jgi:formate dehydrogenase iron-sulfur subunit